MRTQATGHGGSGSGATIVSNPHDGIERWFEPGRELLVVEDDREIRRFIRAALESEGYRVCESETIARGVIDNEVMQCA